MHLARWFGGGALKQPLRFLSVGVVNTLVGLTIIYLARFGLGASDVAANLLGYGVGLVISFALNRRWTFQHDGRVLPAKLRFLAAFAVAYGANLACVLALTRGLGVTSALAHPAGIPVYTVIFYFLSRYFVFRPQARRVQATRSPLALVSTSPAPDRSTSARAGSPGERSPAVALEDRIT